VVQLQNNQEEISETISRVTRIVEQKRDRFNGYMTIVEYGSLLFIALLLLLIIKQGKAIISSIDNLVTETAKIKADHSYQIPDSSDSEEEFKILTRALK